MEFEFDAAKSARNKAKHGIDFPAAQALLDDVDRIEIPARTQDEARFLVIGKIGQRLWSAIVTPREQRIRIISVRAARRKEIEIYESEDL